MGVSLSHLAKTSLLNSLQCRKDDAGQFIASLLASPFAR